MNPLEEGGLEVWFFLKHKIFDVWLIKGIVERMLLISKVPYHHHHYRHHHNHHHHHHNHWHQRHHDHQQHNHHYHHSSTNIDRGAIFFQNLRLALSPSFRLDGDGNLEGLEPLVLVASGSVPLVQDFAGVQDEDVSRYEAFFGAWNLSRD